MLLIINKVIICGGMVFIGTTINMCKNPCSDWQIHVQGQLRPNLDSAECWVGGVFFQKTAVFVDWLRHLFRWHLYSLCRRAFGSGHTGGETPKVLAKKKAENTSIDITSGNHERYCRGPSPGTLANMTSFAGRCSKPDLG